MGEGLYRFPQQSDSSHTDTHMSPEWPAVSAPVHMLVPTIYKLGLRLPLILWCSRYMYMYLLEVTRERHVQEDLL